MSNNCNSCDSSQAQLLYKKKGYNSLKIFDIYQCLHCGLVYANVNQNDIKNAYEHDYYQTVYPDYESDKNINRLNNIQYLKEIEKYFPLGKMIEIGSAFGFFLETAVERGWDATGYETSHYASSIAIHNGIDVKNIEFLETSINFQSDVVCLLDTIEHLIDARAIIQKISQVLKPGGGLFFTTGNIKSFYAKIMKQKWRLMVPPLHIYYYSPESIRYLLKQHGFSIISIQHCSKYYNLGSLIQYLTKISKHQIPQLPLKINLGDVMSILAIRD